MKIHLIVISFLFLTFLGFNVKGQTGNKIISIELKEKGYDVIIDDLEHYNALKNMGSEYFKKKYKAVEGILEIEIGDERDKKIKVIIANTNANFLLNQYFNITEDELKLQKIY